MDIQNENKDYVLARRICNDLLSGNQESILELYHKYHAFFSTFTRQRLYDFNVNQPENILTDYWVELLNSKAICGYEGKSSLRTYLTVILNRRIIDANRKIEREKNSRAVLNDQENDTNDKTNNHPSPEDELIKKEQQKIIHEALLKLAEISPRDSKLILMHFEGMTYEEMAKSELKDEKANKRKLKKMTDSIKKQFSRNKTGSIAKFKSVLNRCLDKNSIKYLDLLN